MNTLAIEKYDEMTRSMKNEWPALKAKLIEGQDEKLFGLMIDYHSAFLVYDSIMDDRSSERRILNFAYAKIANRIYGPILPEE
jgi:hypothetical protein